MEVNHVENIECKYCGSEPKMTVDPTHECEARVSEGSQSELRRVPEQRMLGSSDVLDNGLVFQHELRRVPEPSIGHVARPVRIGSATLMGNRSANQLEREFMF